MPRYSYAIATGHGVALGSLTNFETLFRPYTQPQFIAPRSQPVNEYPIESMLLSGQVRGDGRIDHVLTYDILPMEALDFYIDTFLVTSSVVVKSKAVTLYLRRHDRSEYARYNAYAVLPVPGQDYEYRRGYAVNLLLRYTRLVRL